jgi:hypothetical protein
VVALSLRQVARLSNNHGGTIKRLPTVSLGLTSVGGRRTLSLLGNSGQSRQALTRLRGRCGLERRRSHESPWLNESRVSGALAVVVSLKLANAEPKQGQGGQMK